MILSLIAAATFPVLFAGLLSIRSYQREMVARIDDFNLRSATLAASQIGEALSHALRSLQLSAQLIPFKEFNNKEDLSHALKIPYRQFDFINIAVLLDDKGELVAEPAYEENPKGLKGLEKHEPIFETDVATFVLHIPLDRVKERKIAYGATYYAARTDTPRMAIAVAVPGANDEPPWFLAAEINMFSILKKIRDIRPSAHGTAYLVDGEGRVISHPDASFTAKRVSLASLDIVRHGIERKTPLTGRYSSLDGTKMTGAFGPISSVGWGLVVAQPIEEAFASVKKMRNTTVLWVLIGLSAALVVGLFLSIGLAAPIKALADGAEHIAEGRYGETIDVKSHSETAQLSVSFNKMSNALKSSFDTIYRQKEEIAKWNEELQQRVKERTRELREAEEQIIRSEKMAAVAELSAGMAHEINNPLTSILGFSQLMRLKTGPEHEYAKYLNAVSAGAERIRKIVDDMLRFSRTAEKTNFTDVALNRIIENTLQMVSRRLSERRILTEVSLCKTLPNVRGDSAELQQVVIHLINNAKNAMPNGGSLKIATHEVEGGAVKISIADTGVGIPEENLSKIFNPFFTTKDEWGRTGVGLSVVDRIVREHGGKVSVAGKCGQGAAFSVYLPGAPRATHLG